MSAEKIPGFHYPYTTPAGTQEEKEICVAPNVYVFTGPSNIILVIGPEGHVLIDSGGSALHARKVAGRIKELTDKPLAGIILTHSHPDHGTGGSIFLEGQGPLPVWSRSNFGVEAKGFAGLEKISGKRAARQFGAVVPPDMHKPNPMLPPKNPDDKPLAPIRPNNVFDGDMKKLRLAGVDFELYAAPGETADQLFVWLPEQKIMACADNFYGSFPNLYAVRGSAYRDVLVWAQSLDKMLAFDAQVIIPGHNEPETGAENCKKRLTNHRDAIMYVYNETVKGMNEGLSPEELATGIALPKELAELPYLSEFYGCVPWAVRSIYSGLLGWFDGNPSNLVILSPEEEASRMAALAGGADHLLFAAREALKAEDYRWVTKLADYYLNLGPNARHEGQREAKRLKAAALLALAEIILPITGVNYLQSCAVELRKEVDE